ncbi:hypothetical protein F2Q68_00044002 [Brassica cretica]|uniref:Uncharacterized protein n=1 Tax=Brassica cretica TaxID=69181 RepID=A0A8S9LRJ8_BRACR|nr:hypothetical protein F2Q68_00044002 [Brassica cretica]
MYSYDDTVASIDTVAETSISTITEESSCKSGRFRDDLEESGEFGVFWSLLSAELHRRVICLAMDGDLPTVRLSPSFGRKYTFDLAFQCRWFEVNQHPVADVMPVLLKSG